MELTQIKKVITVLQKGQIDDALQLLNLELLKSNNNISKVNFYNAAKKVLNDKETKSRPALQAVNTTSDGKKAILNGYYLIKFLQDFPELQPLPTLSQSESLNIDGILPKNIDFIEPDPNTLILLKNIKKYVTINKKQTQYIKLYNNLFNMDYIKLLTEFIKDFDKIQVAQNGQYKPLFIKDNNVLIMVLPIRTTPDEATHTQTDEFLKMFDTAQNNTDTIESAEAEQDNTPEQETEKTEVETITPDTITTETEPETVQPQTETITGDEVQEITPEQPTESTYYRENYKQSYNDFIDVKSQLPKLIQMFIDTKQLNKNTIVLYKISDFLETFFEDSTTLCDILDLTLCGHILTINNKDVKILKTGFPIKVWDSYKQKLFNAGYTDIVIYSDIPNEIIYNKIETPKQADTQKATKIKQNKVTSKNIQAETKNETTPPKNEPKPQTNNNFKVETNKKYNGLEIYFTKKPDYNVIEQLKNHHFRWHKIKQCWFATATDDNKKFITELCTEDKTSVQELKKESDKQDNGNQNNTPETKKPNNTDIKPLWDRIQTKNIELVDKNKNWTSNELKQYFKTIFPEVKMSIKKGGYGNNFELEIKESPYFKGSIYLNYITNFITVFSNHSTKTYNKSDFYTDYFDQNDLIRPYNLIAYDYNEVEPTEAQKQDMKNFDNSFENWREQEEIRRQQEQEKRELQYQKEREEIKKADEIRQQNKIDIENHITTSEADFDITCLWATLNKQDTLQSYIDQVKDLKFYKETITVNKQIYFTDETIYNNYTNMLMSDMQFINTKVDYNNEKKCYTGGIAVYLNNDLKFVIDSQGYSYARYVGILETKTDLTEEQINNNKIISLFTIKQAEQWEVEYLKEDNTLLKVTEDNDYITAIDSHTCTIINFADNPEVTEYNLIRYNKINNNILRFTTDNKTELDFAKQYKF